MNQVIGELIVSDTNKTVVSLSDYKGKDQIDIRDYFKTERMSDWAPTKRGVRWPIEQASQLVSLFERVEDTITKEKAK